MRFFAIVLGILCAVATAAGIFIVRGGSVSSVLHAATAAASPAASKAPDAQATHDEAGSATRSDRLAYVGIVTNSLENFQELTSAYPTLTVNYLHWGSSFPTATILANRRMGATTLVVIEPERVSLNGIASGREDPYLKKFAVAERALGIPILLSFGPEANGDWYPWGAHHITPALYKAMWQRVHDVVMTDGGTRITWLWQMNVPWPQSEAMSLLWPGSRYVDEVGIDGQLTKTGQSFSSVFDESLTQIRQITSKPILVSEVSVKAGPEMPREIGSLFDGACTDHLQGVVLFDIHKEWQFDDDTQALAAFKKGATSTC